MDYEIIREYSGNGKFTFIFDKTISINSTFSIYHFSNGKIIVKCELDMFSKESTELVNMNKRGTIDVQLEGIVDFPRGKVTIEKAYINSIKMEFNEKNKVARTYITLIVFIPVEIVYNENNQSNYEVRIGLTNFIFGGCEKTKTDTGVTFNKFVTKLDGHEYKFVQKDNYKEIIQRLKDRRGVHLTSELVCDCSKNSIKNMQQFLDDITNLISFSSRTTVSYLYEDYYFRDVITKTILYSALTRGYHHRNQVINSDHLGNCHLAKYLELVYQSYIRLKTELGLNIAISIYLESSEICCLEMRFLLMFTSLECLLSNYEEKMEKEGNPLLTSSIKKNKEKILKILGDANVSLQEDTLKKIIEAISYPSPFFNDKLLSLLKKFSIKHDKWDLQLNQIRNKVVHSGLFPEKIKYDDGKERVIDGLEEYRRLTNFIDRIILTILEYKKNPYLNILNNYKEEILA